MFAAGLMKPPSEVMRSRSAAAGAAAGAGDGTPLGGTEGRPVEGDVGDGCGAVLHAATRTPSNRIEDRRDTWSPSCGGTMAGRRRALEMGSPSRRTGVRSHGIGG